MTKDEVIKEYMSSLGKRCLETMTKAQRSKRAKIAGKTRWKKYYENKRDGKKLVGNNKN